MICTLQMKRNCNDLNLTFSNSKSDDLKLFLGLLCTDQAAHPLQFVKKSNVTGFQVVQFYFFYLHKLSADSLIICKCCSGADTSLNPLSVKDVASPEVPSGLLLVSLSEIESLSGDEE